MFNQNFASKNAGKSLQNIKLFEIYYFSNELAKMCYNCMSKLDSEIKLGYFAIKFLYCLRAKYKTILCAMILRFCNLIFLIVK